MGLELATSLLSLVNQGSTSNWWGIGCPSHCRGPGLGSLLAAYLFGVLSCIAIFALAYFRLHLPAPSLEPVLTPARRRLSGYLHE